MPLPVKRHLHSLPSLGALDDEGFDALVVGGTVRDALLERVTRATSTW